MDIGWFLKFIYVFRICISKACEFNFDLLGHLVTAHLGMPRSSLPICRICRICKVGVVEMPFSSLE